MATGDKSTSTTGTHIAGTIGSSAIVAAGRTIVMVAGEKDDREYITYGPGETVSLSAREITRLRALGFLKDEEAEEEAAAGPTVKQEGGGPAVTKGTK